MANYEVLKVNMDIDKGSNSLWEEVLSDFQQRMKVTTSAVAKLFGVLGNQVEKNMDSVSKKLSGGQYAKSIKRTVSGFDQLNRLAKNTASGSVAKVNQELVQSTTELAGKVSQLGNSFYENIIKPFVSGNVSQGMGNLGQLFTQLLMKTKENTTGINSYADAWERLNLKTDFWYNLITYSNRLTGTFNEAMAQSGLAVGLTTQELERLNLQMSNGSGGWQGLGNAATTAWNKISGLWSGSGNWFTQTVTAPVNTAFSGMMGQMEQSAANGWSGTKSVFSDAGSYFSGVFTDAWGQVNKVMDKDGKVFTQVEDGMVSSFKGTVNRLIDGFNTVAVTPFSGLNKVLDRLQNMKVGSLQPFKSLSWRSTIPKIPYLAQGAVLPANKPFLAMVGDQRHGTNIEAPLSTIEEAMASVMGDFSGANMAGHDATVTLLGQILNAVRGIRIGDDTIAAAYARHQQKMDIITGR